MRPLLPPPSATDPHAAIPVRLAAYGIRTGLPDRRAHVSALGIIVHGSDHAAIVVVVVAVVAVTVAALTNAANEDSGWPGLLLNSGWN